MTFHTASITLYVRFRYGKLQAMITLLLAASLFASNVLVKVTGVEVLTLQLLRKSVGKNKRPLCNIRYAYVTPLVIPSASAKLNAVV